MSPIHYMKKASIAPLCSCQDILVLVLLVQCGVILSKIKNMRAIGKLQREVGSKIILIAIGVSLTTPRRGSSDSVLS